MIKFNKWDFHSCKFETKPKRIFIQRNVLPVQRLLNLPYFFCINPKNNSVFFIQEYNFFAVFGKNKKRLFKHPLEENHMLTDITDVICLNGVFFVYVFNSGIFTLKGTSLIKIYSLKARYTDLFYLKKDENSSCLALKDGKKGIIIFQIGKKFEIEAQKEKIDFQIADFGFIFDATLGLLSKKGEIKLVVFGEEKNPSSEFKFCIDQTNEYRMKEMMICRRTQNIFVLGYKRKNYDSMIFVVNYKKKDDYGFEFSLKHSKKLDGDDGNEYLNILGVRGNQVVLEYISDIATNQQQNRGEFSCYCYDLKSEKIKKNVKCFQLRNLPDEIKSVISFKGKIYVFFVSSVYLEINFKY